MNEPVAEPAGPTPFISVAALRLQAEKAGIPLRQPPAEPTTCCGRGCNGCVWESYWAAMDWWREETMALLEKQRTLP